MAIAARVKTGDAFRHEALLYSGEADFVARTLPFLREGVHRSEPALVVVSDRKIRLLTDALGDDAGRVTFADMAEVGHNPARIIPAWRRFVAARPPGRAVRGIGEPIHPAREPDELVECQRHEALLNLAFEGVANFALVCPYDTTALAPDVVDEALRTHPWVYDAGGSPAYRENLPEHPLPPPPAGYRQLAFGAGPLDEVHAFVRVNAAEAGLRPGRVTDLDLAVHELAINTIRHAGGRGVLLFWTDDGDVVCEVRDDGIIRDPLVGRTDPTADQEGGRGVWIVNQLCDLVQMRSSHAGTVVRVRMSLAG